MDRGLGVTKPSVSASSAYREMNASRERMERRFWMLDFGSSKVLLHWRPQHVEETEHISLLSDFIK
jgi:hypothetical protein